MTNTQSADAETKRALLIEEITSIAGQLAERVRDGNARLQDPKFKNWWMRATDALRHRARDLHEIEKKLRDADDAAEEIVPNENAVKLLEELRNHVGPAAIHLVDDLAKTLVG